MLTSAAPLESFWFACRAQVATQLKELVQHQHQQLKQSHTGAMGPAHGHSMLSCITSGQGDEMTELKALVHSLRHAALLIIARSSASLPLSPCISVLLSFMLLL